MVIQGDYLAHSHIIYTDEVNKDMNIIDKTIILVLSSTKDDKGEYNPNAKLQLPDGSRVPYTTADAGNLAAFGRQMPSNLVELELATKYLEAQKAENKTVTIVAPAIRAWKPGDKFDNAINVIGWEQITDKGTVVNPTIMINLTKIAPEVFGKTADGKDHCTFSFKHDMGLFDGSLNEDGVQILREWQAIADREGMPLYKSPGGSYSYKVKGRKYQPDWQEKERGLGYPSLRFADNAAMYIVLKWDGSHYARVPIMCVNYDGSKLMTKKGEQKREPGFGMIGYAPFSPWTWDSKTCRETCGQNNKGYSIYQRPVAWADSPVLI